jgi:hypothetical protein
LLASVYLHDVLDLWVQWWRSRHAYSDDHRAMDDFIVGFEYQQDAQRLRTELREWFVRFGRYLAPRRAARGLGKPDAFEFLGFLHLCGNRRRGGSGCYRRPRETAQGRPVRCPVAVVGVARWRS